MKKNKSILGVVGISTTRGNGGEIFHLQKSLRRSEDLAVSENLVYLYVSSLVEFLQY